MPATKQYELTNHLGNVLSTVTDKKVLFDNDNDALADWSVPEISTANDYYPFGMLMPGRNYEAQDAYRFGFNGKQNDNDLKGEGNLQDYGMRMYDSRLGRFISVDPLKAKFPYLSTYQFGSNNPIRNIDLDGLEGIDNSAQSKTLPIWLRATTAKSTNSHVQKAIVYGSQSMSVSVSAGVGIAKTGFQLGPVKLEAEATALSTTVTATPAGVSASGSAVSASASMSFYNLSVGTEQSVGNWSTNNGVVPYKSESKVSVNSGAQGGTQNPTSTGSTPLPDTDDPAPSASVDVENSTVSVSVPTGMGSTTISLNIQAFCLYIVESVKSLFAEKQAEITIRKDPEKYIVPDEVKK